MKNQDPNRKNPAPPPPAKRPYEPPAIVNAVRAEGRASTCDKSDGSCIFGPTSS